MALKSCKKRTFSNFKSLYFILICLILIIIIIIDLLSITLFLLLIRHGITEIRIPPRIPILVFFFNLALGFLISAVTIRLYLRPTKQLISAANEISRGNFSVRVDVKKAAKTEFSELQRSFNRMAEELGGIEIFRNDFINNFSHEFKTPLVSIRGFANQLKSENLTPEQQKEYVDIIISESDRLAKLSNNILLLSKLENQQIITSKSDFSLDEQIRQSILLLEKQWSEKNIELDLDLDEFTVTANEEMTSQIWINLISNAIKFSSNNGIISISCKKTNGLAHVSISDTGCGMSKNDLDRIFDKFYQADTSHRADGNGLGLSIVRRIVDMHGGEIKVSSTQGEGSCFEIFLNILKK